jgi:hypothetical protein
MMSEIERALKKASDPKFWGQLQVDFQGGKPVVIRTIETTNLKAKARDEETNREDDKFNR